MRAMHERIRRLETACGLANTEAQPGVEAIAPVVKNFLDARLAPIEHLLYELDNEATRYSGIYQSGKTYKRGQSVTLNGGEWRCLEATDSRPGTDGSWKLMVKSNEPRRDREKSAEPKRDRDAD